MTEVDEFGKEYLTPEKATDQIAIFIKMREYTDFDKYEETAFLIENAYVSGAFGYGDDLLIFLNSFSNDKQYTSDDVPKIARLIEEDAENGHTRVLKLRKKR